MGFLFEAIENGYVHNRADHVAHDLSFAVQGRVVPCLEVELKPGEGIICAADTILRHDSNISIKAWPGLNGDRLLVLNGETKGELSVTLSTGFVGYAGGFMLGEYQGRLLCPVSALMANGPGVSAGFYAKFRKQGLDMVIVEGQGWAFLRSSGDVIEYRILAGQSMQVRAHSIAAMTATIDFDPVDDICSGGVSASRKTPAFARLTGPGVVWLQSMAFEGSDRLPEITRPKPQNISEIATGGVAFVNGSSA